MSGISFTYDEFARQGIQPQLNDLKLETCAKIIDPCHNEKDMDFIESMHIAKHFGKPGCLNKCMGDCDSPLINLAIQLEGQ